MRSPNDIPRPPSRGAPGLPRRRGVRIMPRLAPALAPGLILFCAACLPMDGVGTPPVAIDDAPAATACDPGRIAQGPALAVPAAQLQPYGAAAGPDAGAAPADAAVFRVAYDLSAASGTLTRAPLVRGEDGAAMLLAPQWDAAAVLAATPPAARRIYTLDPGSRPPGATVPFEWARLSAAQRAALDRPPAGGAEEAHGDGLGADRLAWLRGERALEGGAFRRRAGLLGDAVHGAPLYVGAGAKAHGDAAYAAFHARTLRRPGAVYLGANDGMLHAFDADTGAELFAYVPAMLVPALSELAAPGYTHRAWVDGPLAAGEAFIRDAWRSVLVAAPGAGAQGVFALDVTDPAGFDAGLGALWEFTQRDDAAIGNVMQPAQVGRLKLRTRDGMPQYRHFALAGNGLNSYAADGAQGAPHGSLFLLALDKPAAERWRLDTNYYRLDTPPGDPALPSGLGAPALVTDDDGVVRHAYAGDLQGKLWRFDFTRNAPWRTNPALHPVFSARDAAGRPQPITQPPKIVHAEGGGYLVLFGTGSLYGRAERDPARFAAQSYYAIHDDPAAVPPPAPPGRADLLERRLDGRAGDAELAVAGRLAPVGAGGRARGWYMDFTGGTDAGAGSGERSIAAGAIVDGKLVFTTVVPGADACADSASRLYVLDALSGLPVDGGGAASARGVAGVLMPEPVQGVPLLLPGARRRTPRAPAGRIDVGRTTAIVPFGAASGMPLAGASSSATWPAGRLAWREVANWHQLHRAAAAVSPQGQR